MKIDRVSVTYGELRSSGYPNFSNTRHELSLSATLEPGDSAESVKEKLFEYAKQAVKEKFGDSIATHNEMTRPA